METQKHSASMLGRGLCECTVQRSSKSCKATWKAISCLRHGIVQLRDKYLKSHSHTYLESVGPDRKSGVLGAAPTGITRDCACEKTYRKGFASVLEPSQADQQQAALFESSWSSAQWRNCLTSDCRSAPMPGQCQSSSPRGDFPRDSAVAVTFSDHLGSRPRLLSFPLLC